MLLIIPTFIASNNGCCALVIKFGCGLQMWEWRWLERNAGHLMVVSSYLWDDGDTRQGQWMTERGQRERERNTQGEWLFRTYCQSVCLNVMNGRDVYICICTQHTQHTHTTHTRTHALAHTDETPKYNTTLLSLNITVKERNIELKRWHVLIYLLQASVDWSVGAARNAHTSLLLRATAQAQPPCRHNPKHWFLLDRSDHKSMFNWQQSNQCLIGNHPERFHQYLHCTGTALFVHAQAYTHEKCWFMIRK